MLEQQPSLMHHPRSTIKTTRWETTWSKTGTFRILDCCEWSSQLKQPMHQSCRIQLPLPLSSIRPPLHRAGSGDFTVTDCTNAELDSFKSPEAADICDTMIKIVIWGCIYEYIDTSTVWFKNGCVNTLNDWMDIDRYYTIWKPLWNDEIRMSEQVLLPASHQLLDASETSSIDRLEHWPQRGLGLWVLWILSGHAWHDRATRLDKRDKWWGQVAAQSPVMSWAACSKEMHCEATSDHWHDGTQSNPWYYWCKRAAAGNHCWSARSASRWKRTLMPALLPEGW